MTTETIFITENVILFMSLLVSYWGVDDYLHKTFRKKINRKKLTYPSRSKWHRFDSLLTKETELKFSKSTSTTNTNQFHIY